METADVKIQPIVLPSLRCMFGDIPLSSARTDKHPPSLPFGSGWRKLERALPKEPPVDLSAVEPVVSPQRQSTTTTVTAPSTLATRTKMQSQPATDITNSAAFTSRPLYPVPYPHVSSAKRHITEAPSMQPDVYCCCCPPPLSGMASYRNSYPSSPAPAPSTINRDMRLHRRAVSANITLDGPNQPNGRSAPNCCYSQPHSPLLTPISDGCPPARQAWPTARPPRTRAHTTPGYLSTAMMTHSSPLLIPKDASDPPFSDHPMSMSLRYHCVHCRKTFSRPSSLRIHTYSHTGEKPHGCPHPGCDRRFSVQSNMRRHLRVHYTPDPSPYDYFRVLTRSSYSRNHHYPSTAAPPHLG